MVSFVDINAFPMCGRMGDAEAELGFLRAHALLARNRAYCTPTLNIAEIKSSLCNIQLRLTQNCIGPYSNFHVGAALLTKSGHVITGANVENVAFPTTTCAERVALGTAIASAQCKSGDFKAIGVATYQTGKDDGTTTGYCGPCGNCRQALREFCDVSLRDVCIW